MNKSLPTACLLLLSLALAAPALAGEEAAQMLRQIREHPETKQAIVKAIAEKPEMKEKILKRLADDHSPEKDELLRELGLQGAAQGAAPSANKTKPSDPQKPAPAKPLETPKPRTDGKLVFDFKNVPLDQILAYLSKETGYRVINSASFPKPLTFATKDPLTPAQTFDALNDLLTDQGHILLTTDKTLRLLTLADARTANVPVQVGADPKKVDGKNRMVTQIIPLSYLSASKMAALLTPLINPQKASLTANAERNTLILTDLEVNVRKVMEILKTLDQSQPLGTTEIRVFPLKYAGAQRVADILNRMFEGEEKEDANAQRMMYYWGGRPASEKKNDANPTDEKIITSADPLTNNLVVRASPKTLDKMEKIIAKLDVNTSASESILVYRVKHGKSADLAKVFFGLFQAANAQQPQNKQQRQEDDPPWRAQKQDGKGEDGGKFSDKLRVVSEDTSNSVVIFTSERSFPDVVKVLEKLDIPKKQVLIRAVVAEVDITNSADFGVELSVAHPAGDTTANRAFSNFNIFDAATGVNGYLIDNQHFQATLRALEGSTRFQVLDRQCVMAANNQLGHIKVGKTVPVVSGSTTTNQGTPVINNTTTPTDVGLTIDVTPNVNDNGLIVMQVAQSNLSLSTDSVTVAAGVNAPIINKSEITTMVVARQGQTVIIGGLLQDSVTDEVSKVPLLGDLPLIGELFKRHKHGTAKTEMLVFLTPQLVENPDNLSQLSDEIRVEAQLLNSTIEPGLLARHLDRLRAAQNAASPQH